LNEFYYSIFVRNFQRAYPRPPAQIGQERGFSFWDKKGPGARRREASGWFLWNHEQTWAPFFGPEFKIPEEDIMEKNGKQEEAKYKLADGQPIKFYTQTLSEIFANTVDRLEDLAMVLKKSSDENLVGTGEIIRDLLNAAWEEMEKKEKIIEANLGEISMDSATYGQDGIEGEEFLGLNFIPKKSV